MQSLAWEQLFRAIPDELRNILILTTRAGIEITIQMLLRIEPECLVVRGRLAGTQDAGRVFFIPYEQIDNLGFMREMKEAEFVEAFAHFKFPARNTPAPPSPVVETPQPLPNLADDLPLTPVMPGVTPSRMNIPIKSEVLERFRSRTSSSNGSTTHTLNGKSPPEDG